MKFLRFVVFALLILPVVALCVLGMLAHGAAWAFMVGWRAPQTFKAKQKRDQEIAELEELGQKIARGEIKPWF